jgi:hypothetical protein
MTKKQAQYIRMYNRSTERSIFDAYKTPSDNKVRIYYRCVEMMRTLQGHDGRVISHSCHFFSFAFLYNCPVDGNIKLMVITPSKMATIDWRDDV